MPEVQQDCGRMWPRALVFISGLGMAVFSFLTIRHFFQANFPATIFEGSFCDLNAFFNCDSSAFSSISQIAGVPLGYFGLFVGFLVMLGAIFPSPGFERTNQCISLLNAVGVITLFLYSVLYLKSLCLLCSGFYIFSLIAFFLYWKWGMKPEGAGRLAAFTHPSIKFASTFLVVMLLGAYAMALYHEARKDALSGTGERTVKQYYTLPTVSWPSIVSPFWTAKSTEKFEDAPIRIVEYADFLCPDCLYLTQQMDKLKKEFKGKINIAFQFFPLEARCNDVVDKDKHPGACDVSYFAAQDPSKFLQIHDEVFANFEAAKKPEWRKQLAAKFGVEGALTDEQTKETVHRIIRTGAEYEKTSDRYAHGIRSTPTMIVNNRMIIGTLPYAQLRAIFQALVEEHEKGSAPKFIENWVPTKD
jgi:uncharacterized membrane protein/predicted DsbA family dithiol-disulfide isomerase